MQEKHIADLVTLLDATSSYLCQQGRPSATSESLSFGMIAEFTAAVVAKCCDTQEQQVQLASAGVIPPLVNLLHSGHIKVNQLGWILKEHLFISISLSLKAQEAALDALATLCRENNELGEIIIHAKRKCQGMLLFYQQGNSCWIMYSLWFKSAHSCHHVGFRKGQVPQHAIDCCNLVRKLIQYVLFDMLIHVI